MQHPGERDVVDIGAMSCEQPGILDPPGPRPCVPSVTHRGDFSHSLYSCIPWRARLPEPPRSSSSNQFHCHGTIALSGLAKRTVSTWAAPWSAFGSAAVTTTGSSSRKSTVTRLHEYSAPPGDELPRPASSTSV